MRMLPAPGDGGGWEIDGVDLEVQRVAARPAAEIEAAVEVEVEVEVDTRFSSGFATKKGTGLERSA